MCYLKLYHKLEFLSSDVLETRSQFQETFKPTSKEERSFAILSYSELKSLLDGVLPFIYTDKSVICFICK